MYKLFDSLKDSIKNLRQRKAQKENKDDQSMDTDDLKQDVTSEEAQNTNGEIIYTDEAQDKDQAKTVKKNAVLTIAGAVTLCVAAAVGSNVLFSDQSKTDPPLNNASLATNNGNAGADPSKGLPDKYSDISKYSPANKNANQNQQPQQARKTADPIKPQNNVPSTSSYLASYAARNNQNNQQSVQQAPAIPRMSEAEKAALEEEKRIKSEESKALRSAISFATAVNRNAYAGGGAPAPANAGNPSAQRVVSTSYSITDGPSNSGAYALQAGSVIQATLITGITTDVEGSNVVAQVRQNIYDTQTGEHLLIPQGSRLIGKSTAAGGRGNPRVKVAFTRLIYPDGHDITLPNEQAIDGVGYSGLKDKYTEHSGKLYGTAFVTALLAAAAQSATGDSSGSDDRSPGQEAVSGAVADVLNSAKSLIDRQSNVQPTATIRPGMEFSVFITQDLFLDEYED